MASIKCSKCGRGIHYHDEPDGTEWTAFGISSWEELVDSGLECASFKTSGDNDWYSIWKCKACGSLHFFKNMGTELIAAYELVETTSVNVHGEVYVAFEDTEWDEITELDWTTDEIRNGIKDVEHFYLIVDDKAVAVSEDAMGTKVKKVYRRIQDVLASTS